MEVEVGFSAGVGVGSLRSQASSAAASMRLNTKAPSKVTVLGCDDAEMIISVNIRRRLNDMTRIIQRVYRLMSHQVNVRDDEIITRPARVWSGKWRRVGNRVFES